MKTSYATDFIGRPIDQALLELEAKMIRKQVKMSEMLCHFDELAKILTHYGAESTQAQVAAHCLRHGSKQAQVALPNGPNRDLTAVVSTETDEDGTCCVVRFEQAEAVA